jgi:hypothetical protein
MKLKDYSQAGESLILWDVFQKIGAKNKFAVEFGASDGYWLSNIRTFLENGWSGLQMEGVSEPKNEVKSEFVTKDNINLLFKKYSVPENFDLLSIDIDGNDYWVWKNLEYNPSAVIIEYNSNFSKTVSVALEYDETHTFDGSYAYSASFKAYEKLAEKKGYYFYAEVRHTNLIFIKNEYRGMLGQHPSISNIEKLPIYDHGQVLKKEKRFIEV